MTPITASAASKPSGSPALIEVKDLVVDFSLPRRGVGRHRRLRAVSGVSFDVGVGETLGLVGESGSGKTTIGRAILGLVSPTAGSITFDGSELVGLRASKRRPFSAEMQIVFQNPYTSLNPAMRIGDAIGEPLHVHRGLRGDELDAAVTSLLRRVGLDPGAASRLPHAFSGGQRQRIAIARAIALNPRFVIYDEAVSALDVSTRGQIINLMAALRREMGLASLFIGHDLAVVRHISDRIAVLYRGHLVEVGAADDVADRPRHPYTRRLVRSILLPDPDAQALRRGELLRRTPSAAPRDTGCPYTDECPERLAVCELEVPPLLHVADRWVACHLTEASARLPAVPVKLGVGDANGPAVWRRPLACVEVGGSSIQTVVFDGDAVVYYDGVVVPEEATIAVAVPGSVREGRVTLASSLGWRDVDAAAMLGMSRSPEVICNDAEAAALGEWLLRGQPADGLVLVGLGTGVGGAVIQRGRVVASNLFGHQTGFSSDECVCGGTGCLETVAAGWALPNRVGESTLRSMATAVATAIELEPAAAGVDVVVVSGGLVDAYGSLLELLADALPSRSIVTSVRPPGAKSAAAWGLRHLLRSEN